MSKVSTIEAARTAIRTAVATDTALIEARTANRDAWSKAYALVWSARQGGATVNDVSKGSGVSGATVSACELAAMLDHPAAWARLEVLPARKGQRRTTIHSLVLAAIASKAKGDVPAVRAVIADMSAKVAKVAQAAKDAGVEPDASRIADHYSAAIGKVHDLTAAKDATTGKQTETGKQTGTETGTETETDATETGGTETETDPASTMQQRVLRLAAECGAVRLALSGGHVISRNALVALGRESRDLAHDIAAMLDASQDMAATG